ncbi:ROK family transcriptional regulator [Antribacter sp. KLBMP9083]|uniref:ROK family transcriptional regulator n=1 Tax=Antribacter soli TaxID=2910976 RepID=A0AA41QEF6_9MICO|nr:ROK family transcriptional regulator [Antribacter soli]MCF4121295.1 ROK family transcriptional regulator [Antribacter soli]
MAMKALSANELGVIELLLTHRSLSRSDLAATTGLSKPATNDLIARLVEGGLVVEAGEVGTLRRGPNAMHFRAATEIAVVAGVVMQPTHVSAVVADLAGDPLGEVDVPRRGEDPAAHVATAVRAAAVEAGYGSADLWQVVVGTPGVVTPDGDLDFVSEHPDWRTGQRDRLTAALRCPVYLENDVNLAALAEARTGSARDAASFTLLSLDEGLGAATVLDGVLLRGAHGYAGELGLAPAGFGEAPIGTPDAGLHSKVGRRALQELLDDHGLPGRTPEQVLAGDDPAGAGFRSEVARRVAVVVATVCTLLDPELVVLTGSVGIAGGERLAHAAETLIRDASQLRPRIVPTGIGAGAGLSGALAQAVDNARDHVYGRPAHRRSGRL